MIWLEAKVGAKGEIVIPESIRDQMGIRPGDTVRFRTEGGRVILEKRDGAATLEAFLGAYEKRRLPREIDWDALHGSQAEHRFGSTWGRD